MPKKTKKTSKKTTVQRTVKKTKRKAAVRSTSKKKTAKKKIKKKTRSDSSSLQMAREMFPGEYIIDFNGTKAYQRVKPGTSRESAQVMAHKWLDRPEIIKEIKNLIDKRQKRTDTKADEALLECRRIALSDIIGMFKEDGSLKKITEIDENLRRAISSFKVESLNKGRGTRAQEIGTITEIKLWSKDKQIENLMKHHGLFEEDNKQRELSVTDIMAIIMGKNGS